MTDSHLVQECLQVVREMGNELERNAEACNLAALEVNPLPLHDCSPITGLHSCPATCHAPDLGTWSEDELFIEFTAKKNSLYTCVINKRPKEILERSAQVTGFQEINLRDGWERKIS